MEDAEQEAAEADDLVLVAEQVLLLEEAMEVTARGANAVVEAEAARSNQDEKCRNFIGVVVVVVFVLWKK